MTTGRPIVIDGVIFQLQARRPLGISRVWRSLLPELMKALPAREIILLRRGQHSPAVDGLREEEIPLWPTGEAPDFARDESMLARVCDRLSAGIFLSTYFSHAPGLPNCLMVHDMIPEVMGFDLSKPEWVAKQRAIARASRYLAVSDSTKRDLARLSNIPEAAVTLAHAGVSSHFLPAEDAAVESLRRAHGLFRPYIVLAGNRGAYRDYVPFFSALATMPERSTWQVFAFGAKKPILPEEEPWVRRLDLVSTGWIDDATLRAAYTGAVALVYLSRYEGFGLPVAEAMACGCPVITTRCASLPEVGGDAAIYVSPDSQEEIAAALTRVSRPGAREDLATAGRAQAARFTWENMATQVAGAITQAAIP